MHKIVFAIVIGLLLPLAPSVAFSVEETPPSSAVSSESIGGLPSSFSQKEKISLYEAINTYIADATFYVQLNWWLDIGLKWVVLILSALITILAAVAKLQANKNENIAIWLIAFGAISTLASGATNTFNFAIVKGVYQNKISALETLQDTIRFKEPNRNTFLETLSAVRSWNSDTKLDDTRLNNSKH